VDVLDRLAEAAADLLTRVDLAIEEGGAAPDHPVWPLVRRLRALPGDAVVAVAALRPEALAEAGSVLRPLADAYAETGRTAARGVGWTGAAADRFTATAAALATHLSGGDCPTAPGLAGRAHATARFAEALAGWMTETRDTVAHRVATALSSAEAVTLRAAEPGSARAAAAAADIGALILGAVAEAYDAAEELSASWTDRLAEEPYRSPAGDGPPHAGGLSVGRDR
jgi:hypothetical protein